MLADDLAEAVADFGAAVISIRRLRWHLSHLSLRLRWLGNRTDFLDRADADPVCLAQGPIHSSRLGHAHLSAMHSWRNIVGVLWATVTPIPPMLLQLFMALR